MKPSEILKEIMGMKDKAQIKKKLKELSRKVNENKKID